MSDTQSKAPWSAEQVAKLQAWQDCDWVHPYTCYQGHTMTPTQQGWTCICGYQQNWTWAPMLQGPPPDPTEALRRD